MSEPRRFWMSAIALFLAAYGAVTVFSGVWDFHPTMDEGHFLRCGLQFLANRDFHHGTDHPPFSMWFGALWPWILAGKAAAVDEPTVQLARVPHALLYGAVGFAVTALFAFRARWNRVALLFAAFWALSPGLKAATSLHTTDGDATVLAALASALLFTAPGLSPSLAFGAFFAFGLACVSKISVAIMGPPLVLVAVARFAKASSDWRFRPVSGSFGFAVLAGASGFLSAFAIGYLFEIRQALELYPQAFSALALHNRNGHPGMLLGNLFVSRVWYYFPTLLLTKTPLPFLVAFVWAIASRARLGPRGVVGDLGFWVFAAPAIAWFALAMRGNIQIGYRHIVPPVTMLGIFASIGLGSPRAKKSRVAFAAMLVLLLVALVGDWRTLNRDSYLTYFNEAAPWPTTRSFVDSNNDWNQGIPKHLESEAGLPAPVRLDDGEPLRFLRGPPGTRARWVVGATELASLWPWSNPLAPLLRAFRPVRRITGYEVFDLSQEDVFSAMMERQPVFYETGQELRRLDQDLVRAAPAHSCQAGTRPILRSRSGLGRETPIRLDDTFTKQPLTIGQVIFGEKGYPAAARLISGEIELDLPPISHALAVLSSNIRTTLELDPVTTLKTIQERKRGYSTHWLPLNLAQPSRRVRFTMDLRGAPIPPRTLDFGVFWWECAASATSAGKAAPITQ